MFDEYKRGKQPCDNFTPDEHEEWFGTVTHCCPTCGGEGCRMFCLNCHLDHHANGWDTCTPNAERQGRREATYPERSCSPIQSGGDK